MSQPSLKQWYEDRKRLKVVYDHSRAKPVERKNKIKKSRQAAFKSALAERTKPSGQHQYTKTNTSDSSLGKEQCGAQANRAEASSYRNKDTHHMIQIFIKTPINPKTLCLRLDHKTTVSDLKDTIHRKLAIRPALQNLYTNNKRFKLCDALTLLDLGIKPETNIDLTLAEGLLGGAPTLNETLLRTLAVGLRKDWQQLAVELKFRPAEISKSESLAGKVQAHHMLVSWLSAQADDGEAVERLRSALVQIGRQDLAARIPGYAPTAPRAGSKRQSPEHQSTSDGSGINEMLGVVAENIGEDWMQLGTSLGIKAAQIDTYPIDHPNDVKEQIYQMLRDWVGKQTSQMEAEEGLIETLLKLGRADIVQELPGCANTSQGASKIDEVHCKQLKEHQSITDASGIGEKKLGDLAEHIGKDWKRLGISLGIKAAKIDKYQLDYPSDLNQQVFWMLLDWCRHDPEAAEDGLKEALKEIGRTDILKILGEMELPSKALVETLVSHYKETLKVNTHPTAKHLARDMDQLYVSLELLQETNQPDKPLILQSGSVKGKHETDHTMHIDIKGEHETDKTHIEYKKIPLKSYEDILSLDKNRIIITAESGYGKSTLLKKIAYDWAVLQSDTQSTRQKQVAPLSKYELVFLLDINKMEAKFNITDEISSQILPQNEFGKKSFENYMTKNPEKVLILLDGADEISFERLQNANEDFSVYNVLSFKSLKRCKVIVTSRQSTALKLLTCNPDFTRVNINGFDDKNKKEYIRKFFSNHDAQHHDHVLSEINKSETLRILGEIPLFLWLMCSSLTHADCRLPDRITELLNDATSMIHRQKMSKDWTSDNPKKITENGFNELMFKLGQVALERLVLKGQGQNSFTVSEFDSEELVTKGCEVGLLTRVKVMRGIEEVEQVHFYHMIFMQFCCSVYLSGMAESNPDKFNEYMSQLIDGDVERTGYLIRFCSGRNRKAAQCIIGLTGKRLSVYNKNTPVECERYVCLHRIMMLALFEAKLGSTVKTLAMDEWVRFPYKLKGEDLLAAHYFIKNLSERSSLRHVSDITIACQGTTDLVLLKQIMASTRCDLSLQVVGVNMNDKIHQLKSISAFVTSLTVKDCQLSSVSVPQLFKLFQSTTKVKKVCLVGNDLHGLKSDHIPHISSLEVLILDRCKLTKDDIGPVLSIVAVAGSVTALVLKDNDLHGIKGYQITAVSSLNVLFLNACGLKSDDIGSVFSIVAAAGSVTTLILKDNDLGGIKGDQISPVSSLKELHLYACGIQSDDIGSVFSIVAAAGSVTTLVLKDNDLRGIKGDQTIPVSSLKELKIFSCGIQSDDIGSVFSIVAAAGSVTTLVLKDNDLGGIKGDQTTPVSSLKELKIFSCGIQSDDIGSVFSIVAAAGSVTTLVIEDNDLHGIKGDQITAVSSLNVLFLNACGLKSDDIGSVFSTVAAAGSVTTLVLKDNDLGGIKGDQITPVSSLKELHLYACGIQSDDIGSVFSIVAAAGSVTTLVLKDNDLHGIKGDQITPVSSLKELHLYACGIQSDDIGSVFSIVAAAGSVTTLVLKDNDLHGIKGDQITPVSSLKELHLYACGIQSDDIGSVFSIVAAAGSVKTLVLKDNDLHGIKGDQITPVSSLKELKIFSCGIQSDDIGSVFSIVAAAGSVTTLVLKDNDLGGIKGDQTTPVSSLKELHLYACGIQSDDIGSVFSIVAAAGSVTTLVLKDNDLGGIKGDQITPVSSLKELKIFSCGIQSDDIGSVFSIVAAAGSVTTLVLKDNDLGGIKGDQTTPVSSLKELKICSCGIQSDDIESVFSIVAAAGSVTTLVIEDNDLHDIKGDQITAVSSLNVLFLNACGLKSDDIGSVFSIVAAAGSVTTLVLKDNDLGGIKGDQITPVSSLKEFHLYACGIQSDDIGSVFSIVAAAGSVTTLVLKDNDLGGIKGDQTTPVSSLKELKIFSCGIQSDDIGSVFSIVAAAGSVTTLVIEDYDLHGIKGDQITAVSSLNVLFLNACGLKSDDIGSVFSIVAAAGSVTTLVLKDNDLGGIKGDQITAVSSLNVLFLNACGLKSDDIGSVFSIVAAAGSVTTLVLKDNDLGGIKGDQINPVSSLKELHLYACGIQSDDIGSVFSIVAAAGSVTTLVLKDNDLHGIKGDQITPVSSLKEFKIFSCGIQSDDIGSVFSIVAAAGSVTTLVLKDNDLGGIKGDQTTPVSSLKELHLYACGIQSDDIGSVFSIVAAAGSVTTLVLKDNDLNGIKGDQITPVSSLKELKIFSCGIQSDDIGSVFSIVAAAGSVTTLVLKDNDLGGIKGDQTTPVSSLKELHLYACGIQSDDIGSVFSIVAAVGSVTTLVLNDNDLHGIKGDQISPVSSLNELHLVKCDIQSDDIGSVFSIVAAAGSVTTLVLKDNDLSGIKGDQTTPVSSLKELHLYACGIQSDDIGSVFSIVAAAGSVTTLVLKDNDLHGIKWDQITPVSSLKELKIFSCGIQSDDIGSVFSIVAAAGSVTTLVLKDNDLGGIKGDQTTPVSSLMELHLYACGIQSDDIGSVFSIVAAAGSVTTLVLEDNDLHGIKGDRITAVSSLNVLFLNACGLQSDDIGSVFSIVAAAGSVTTLVLEDNNLHGIKGDQITPVSSLKELHLYACGIQSDDIGSVFSIVAAAGSVTTLVLKDNDLHGIKGDQITPVSSLKELHLYACGIQSDDIGSVFSIVAAAGSVKTLVLKDNDLHGIKGDQITPVSSLKELKIFSCGIQSDDIGSVFSIVAAVASVTTLVLKDNDLHGIKGDQITPVSSLNELHLVKCDIQSDDIGSVFSIVAAAGSVTKLVLMYNDLHGIKGDQIHEIVAVSSLKYLGLPDCGLQNDDFRALSLALNMRISGSALLRPMATHSKTQHSPHTPKRYKKYDIP
ncbi:uncharacterized protein [Asterias amurensis]|uniref:uncharacterized protein isoform X2 n=1 Tax=Asterias amurensis TaxID=7602 RepID=UPI003AB57AE7